MNGIRSAMWSDIIAIRQQRPIILNITNFVAMDLTANALLAMGASPMMAHAAEEIVELTALSSALVVNIGTIDSSWHSSMQLAMDSAAKFKKPCIFDPVGAGATRYRKNITREFLERYEIQCLRGNASEIFACYNDQESTGGIDNTASSDIVVEILKQSLLYENRVTVISGAIDYIFGFKRSARIYNGHKIMTEVTAMGCAATAIIGAFLAVNSDFFAATVHAMTLMGICGELAHAKSFGPGSFRTNFLDNLSAIAEKDLVNTKVDSDEGV